MTLKWQRSAYGSDRWWLVTDRRIMAKVARQAEHAPWVVFIADSPRHITYDFTEAKAVAVTLVTLDKE